MEKHLVLVGGGHAHMTTLANIHTFIKKGLKVTVVGPAPFHYYSGMGPGMLGGTYTPEEIRFATREVVSRQGASFIQDAATHIDPLTKKIYLQSGKSISYDVLSFNAGSYVDHSIVQGQNSDIFSVKPIETLIKAQNRIVELCSEKKIKIGIIGGGPSSAELAGNIIQLTKMKKLHRPRITIFSGSDFMARFPEKVKKYISTSLKARGVKILTDSRVKSVTTGKITLKTGETLDTKIIFLASGVHPSNIFKKSKIPTGPDGGLLVNNYLQSIAYPELFGGGDCIFFAGNPLDKVGVYAVRQNPILLHNIMAAMTGHSLKKFHPGGNYLLIFNLGEGTGVLYKSKIAMEGKIPFIIKNFIDRRFMRRFQAIEKQ